ncbi:hypothetical protein B2G50_05125 [Leptospira interrogans serovar Canicola]|nr:hypothetical protein B2G50_05125 [Leptospira interrogans serovar Canicola]
MIEILLNAVTHIVIIVTVKSLKTINHSILRFLWELLQFIVRLKTIDSKVLGQAHDYYSDV